MLIYFISRLYKVLSWEIIVINWIDNMNIIFKKQIIRWSYPNIHLHINYVWSFQEICIYFDWPRHPNGRQRPMTGHYLQHCEYYFCVYSIFHWGNIVGIVLPKAGDSEKYKKWWWLYTKDIFYRRKFQTFCTLCLSTNLSHLVN